MLRWARQEAIIKAVLIHWRVALLSISLALWALLFGAILINALWVPTFAQVGHIERGCYLTDALWFYVQCNGFVFSEMAGVILTVPYLLWLGPVLILWMPLIAVPFLFFLLFPAWFWWSARRRG